VICFIVILYLLLDCFEINRHHVSLATIAFIIIVRPDGMMVKHTYAQTADAVIEYTKVDIIYVYF